MSDKSKPNHPKKNGKGKANNTTNKKIESQNHFILKLYDTLLIMAKKFAIGL